MQVQTYNDISEVLYLKPQSVKRKGDRDGHSYGLNDKLPMPVIVELINDYQNPAPRRTDKTIKAAKKLAKTIDQNTTVNVQVNNIVNSNDKDKDNNSDKELTRNDDKRTTKGVDKDNDKGLTIPIWLIGVVLAPALIWQMEHYAAIVNDLTRIEADKVAAGVFSWFFAFSVTGTAIIMTAAKGDLKYLYVFAFIETMANIIYSQPSSGQEWGTTMLISLAMAFTIFSYSEIFANTVRQDKD